MLHGRARECALLDGLLAGAREQRSGVLVIRGEAGIGKSALLRYAAGRADGMRVLRGAGVESESEFPYAAAHQLLRPVTEYLGMIPARQRTALRGAFGLEAAGEDRFLVSIAILSVLAEVAEKRPLLCLIDDAQWLDGASADALTFAARRLDAEGVVLLFAARDGDGDNAGEDPGDGRTAAAFASPGLPGLRLGGLDPAASDALLAEGVPVAHEVRDVLVANAAGNPLALRELPGSLSADQLAGRVPLPDRLPAGRGVEQVYQTRVRRQPAATQTLLLVAAADESGDVAVVLRAAAELGVPAEALDSAETAGLVEVEADTITFRHPLVRSAVYRGATFLQRRAAHQALAAVLDGPDQVDRRAWQLAAAAIGPDETVAGELERSAERAAYRGGHAAAAAAYERAATLSPDVEARTRRLVSGAAAAWVGGQPDRASDLLARAAPGPDQPGLRAEAEHVRGAIETACGTPAVAYAILVAGADQVAAADAAKAARMLSDAGQVAWIGGDLAGMAETARRLAELPAPGGADGVVAQLITGLASFLRGDTAGATALLRDGARLAEDCDEPRALGLAAGGAMFVGDDARALALFTRAATRARADGAVNTLPAVLAPLAALEMWTGRFASALASATEGLRLAGETGQDNAAAHHRAVLAWIAAVQGRADDCREAADAALARAIGHRLGPQAAIATWALAVLDLGAGRPADALNRLAALANAGPGESHQVVKVFAAADLVEAAVRAGRADQARAALTLLDGWTGHARAPWARALVARCHGLLSAGDEADGHFTAALALHAQGGRPFDAARTALSYGEALRRRRRRADARTQLRVACEGFERLGAAPWAELARVELRATGETARKRDPSTLSQLTPQELQIVRLVGEGATNREVAAQLFLSPRTVDYHLHKVFTKLGLSSRAEVVRLATQNDSAFESVVLPVSGSAPADSRR
jgi:DNA-binding CsgD family transcriptional regulator/tetratricopeptide (TPR) repeat protein